MFSPAAPCERRDAEVDRYSLLHQQFRIERIALKIEPFRVSVNALDDRRPGRSMP